MKKIFDLIHYMNLAELKSFCALKNIPFKIYYTDESGHLTYSGSSDRKGILIKRIKASLMTGKILKPTTYARAVTNFERVSQITKTSKVYFEQYKKSMSIFKLMRSLTKDQFKFGSVAREILLAQWAAGMAPTYEKFARRWLKASRNHRAPNPEWAFLTDKSKGMDMRDWKKIRIRKANEAFRLLSQIFK